MAFLVLANRQVVNADSVVDKKIHHLRAGNAREWDSFKGTPQKQLDLNFDGKEHASETTLSLRQEDVKAGWVVTLNGRDLGKLDQDENARVRYLPVPPNVLKAKGNVLTIKYDSAGKADLLPDDILVGDIQLLDRPTQQLLEEVKVNVGVFEKGINHLIPARITITRLDKALQPVVATPGQQLAVRTGCIYTGEGTASFSLPAGKYKLYASRGFEYSVDSVVLEVTKNKPVSHHFSLIREVPTQGWVSSDTHIHTFTNSGHGDATVQERLLTLAGEGIDLPVFTDHNMVYDAKPLIRKMGLDTVFTPVTGNEFTTKVGHFNVFPLADNAKAADHQVKDWASVSKELGNSNKQVIVLNHGRNIFYNFQPFGPSRHISIAGQDLQEWKLPANAMEVMNSSAQQKDIMQLYRDWFGLLNRGHYLTPLGSSDSHDVMRYLVAQGRTYIQCRDDVPGKINVGEAVDQLLAGRVMVSFGLMAEIKVDGKYGPGDLAPTSGKEMQISARVLGPSWIKADRVSLYANGMKIREVRINKDGKNGVKWEGSWTVPISSQDTYFVAIAEGPDPLHPFWIIPKPYSRMSSVWNPQVIGSSGALWVDADGDTKKTSAFHYAQNLVERSQGNTQNLFKQLASFDESVAVQVASIFQSQGKLNELMSSQAFKNASQQVKNGFDVYHQALKESEQFAKSR
ncbi:CehA/McbA family metallohydrolase [Dyadobacter alkalitolerans]|uniref:CehA/McbA family metallohydrolase n=1 Tax=Dyadobacter alkalitolerans TaxID=492736 RepID=UPI0003F92505|nr:CehA/McbA family metallohydrolase [Dyadobacter alkalitolerans]